MLIELDTTEKTIDRGVIYEKFRISFIGRHIFCKNKEEEKMFRKVNIFMLIILFIVGTFSVIGLAAQDDFLQKIKGMGIKADGTPIKVGISSAELNSEFAVALSKYPLWLLQQAGCEVDFVNPDFDLDRQISLFDDFVSAGKEIIIAQPVNDFAIAPKVTDLRKRGIYFFASNHPVLDKNNKPIVDLYAGSPNEAMGIAAAEFIVEKAAGKKVKVVEIMGPLGQIITTDRDKSFKKVISKHKNIKIVDTRACDWLADKAMDAASDMLTRFPDIFAFYVQSDCMLPGVLAALQRANKLYPIDHKNHVITVACDGAPYALEQIRKGFHDMTIEQSPYAMGTVLAKGVLLIAQGKPLPKSPRNFVSVDPVCITHKNVDDPSLWGNFGVPHDKLWPRTEEIWNKY